MTTISKKDTLDIAATLAVGVANSLNKKISGITPAIVADIADTIQEGLNDWITDCETEDAEERERRIDSTLGTGGVWNGDY